MVSGLISLPKDYWETFEVNPKDIEYINSYLFELEIPLTSIELTKALINERINFEKEQLKMQQQELGKVYLPKEQYQVGDTLIFPALNWQQGSVTSIRPGVNPEMEAFEVITIEMARGVHREFASKLADHSLNQPLDLKIDDEQLVLESVLEKYGAKIQQQVTEALIADPDLVSIGGRWFPSALLVDVNIGHLNLAEAVLDMANGGPLATKVLLEQIDLPSDVNPKLREFSLNYAMQEDTRFDEVGPSGEVLWFLRRLEPESVQQIPPQLQFNKVGYDHSALSSPMITLERQLDDELSDLPVEPVLSLSEEVVILTYPHWRAGTLPLTHRVQKFFPTAIEAPRIQFSLVDGDSGEKYPGWVVRPNRYVYGLRQWYETQGLIPGSLIQVKPGKKPGEVQIQTHKRRSGREWIRTVLVGADGGIVFAILKQMVSAAFDERMAIAIPDADALDQVWQKGSFLRLPLDQVIQKIMRELSKSNPQGHVHAQELYAAVNMIRRCPPGPILFILSTNPAFRLVGDLYFRLDNVTEED